jgi:hypothetical protein
VCHLLVNLVNILHHYSIELVWLLCGCHCHCRNYLILVQVLEQGHDGLLDYHYGYYCGLTFHHHFQNLIQNLFLRVKSN